ncbi:MAG: DUF2807 domain-containing protein [Myxococcota bacterium]
MRATWWAGMMIAAGCGTRGNAEVVTEDRTVPSFTGVSSNNAIEVELVVNPKLAGDDVALQVEAESNLIAQISTEVSNDLLEVDVIENVDATRPMRVVGSIRAFGRAAANNAARVTVSGVETNAVVLSANNAGQISLTGTSATVELEANNGGRIEAPDLEVGNATVDLDNAGAATICVTGAVTRSVSNGGSLTVRCGGDISGVETRNGGSVGDR